MKKLFGIYTRAFDLQEWGYVAYFTVILSLLTGSIPLGIMAGIRNPRNFSRLFVDWSVLL